MATLGCIILFGLIIRISTNSEVEIYRFVLLAQTAPPDPRPWQMPQEHFKHGMIHRERTVYKSTATPKAHK